MCRCPHVGRHVRPGHQQLVQAFTGDGIREHVGRGDDRGGAWAAFDGCPLADDLVATYDTDRFPVDRHGSLTSLAAHLVARGALAAATGQLADANRVFAEAVEIDRRASHPWLAAATLHDWGRASLAAGDRHVAAERFDGALEVYASIGVGSRWTDRVIADRQRARIGAGHIRRGRCCTRRCADLPRQRAGQASRQQITVTGESLCHRGAVNQVVGR